MERAAIVKRDQWMPWHHRGQTLFYVIVWYGAPYIRLFERARSRDHFLRRLREQNVTPLGRGKVRYYPDFVQPQAHLERAPERV